MAGGSSARGSPPPATDDRRRRDARSRARAADRAVRPRPVLRLAVPVLRLRGRRRRGGARPAGAHRGRSSRRSCARSTCAADALRRALRRRTGRRSTASTSAAGRRRSCRPRTSAAILARVRERFGVAAGRRDHPRGQPRAGRARRPGRLRATPASPGCRSGRSRSTCGSLRRLGRRHRARRRRPTPSSRRAPRACASINLDLLYDVPDQPLDDLDVDPRRGPRPGPGPPVAVRADPRRPGRGGPDRPARRPPADDVRRPPLARRGPTRAGRGPRRGRRTTTRR